MNIEIIRSRRKTLALHFSDSKGVVVRAPMRAKLHQIETFIADNGHWIEHHRQLLEKYPGLPESNYYHGGFLYLQGIKRTIIVTKANKAKVTLNDDSIVFELKKQNVNYVSGYIERWKRTYAEKYFEKLTADLHRNAVVDLPPYTFSVRKMKRQWGNCSHSGHIKLSVRLIRYPEACIRHVIFHELTHLKHFNHGARFYGLLSRLNPTWQEDKDLLSHFSG